MRSEYWWVLAIGGLIILVVAWVRERAWQREMHRAIQRNIWLSDLEERRRDRFMKALIIEHSGVGELTLAGILEQLRTLHENPDGSVRDLTDAEQRELEDLMWAFQQIKGIMNEEPDEEARRQRINEIVKWTTPGGATDSAALF